MLKPIAICLAVALALTAPAMAEDLLLSTDAATTVAAAGDVPQAVKDACKDDFEAHCKTHDPESAAAHECMANAFGKLSDPCVTAILDSPLVEQEQQRLADTEASEQNVGAATTKRKAHSATGAKNVRTVKAKPGVRVAKAKYVGRTKYAAVKSKRQIAHRAHAPRRSVAGYVKRGTGIASRYVAKYTRFAFAKVFR